MFSSRRMQREAATIAAMLGIYCRAHHQAETGLCQDCKELLDYAEKRLKYCPFQEKKTTCGKCSIHCYKPAMREKIRQVMRFSGPRMLLRHPYLALMHTLDGFRKKTK